MINKTEQQNKIRIIKAMLNDDEFLRGGIFQDEEKYCKKYNLTLDEMVDIEVALHYALFGGICERLEK